MLTLIRELSNPLLNYIKDDPVRPDIPVDFRVSENRFVSGIVDDDTLNPKAIVCVSLQDFVPASVDELKQATETPTTAIFYTIWSYVPGAARELLFQTVDAIKQQYPTVERFVTLSPQTEMAKKFHLKNGAIVYRENPDTVNYEYLQDR